MRAEACAYLNRQRKQPSRYNGGETRTDIWPRPR